MTPDELRNALGALRWSQRGLAEILGCDDRLVRRWVGGEAAVPPDVADWLQDLAELHASLPPPAAWRRRSSGNTVAGVDTMPVDRTTEVSSVSWDWQPGGKVTAKGFLTIARADSEQPITLHFEIPTETVPRKALADPSNWVLSHLRRALRSTKPPGSGPQRRDEESPAAA
jgi:hypothetical protein